ncbi:TlyA family RNA methyltransferase [Temperatibacter marinus]|uniref:TlyA family RNA methyltransferase n=1 Tax=Temperatibacter marinus TaxID=1456591 RepID=A0AA52EAV6_9PROT|nr:TlyA family RNA methyltransferase [Temperatibacter marinus]WND01937.1 TlyA family RNA methyltransferase [Temperatibacter marinus]
MAKKIRADVALVERGQVESRAKAQALIMAGKVFLGEQKIAKAGHQIKEDQSLDVRGKEHPWVSRGGLKLEKAMKEYAIDPQGWTVIDVGSSTGGFTDVALSHGAACVYSVDVGHGQLAWKLRSDDRVVVLEKTNARYLTEEQISTAADMVVCDASFISLKTVLPAALSLTKEQACMAVLIKPQFEVGRDNVGKGGVVRDPALHKAVCDDMRDWVNSLSEWTVQGITESPIKGPEGNIEFLLYATKGAGNE